MRNCHHENMLMKSQGGGCGGHTFGEKRGIRLLENWKASGGGRNKSESLCEGMAVQTKTRSENLITSLAQFDLLQWNFVILHNNQSVWYVISETSGSQPHAMKIFMNPPIGRPRNQFCCDWLKWKPTHWWVSMRLGTTFSYSFAFCTDLWPFLHSIELLTGLLTASLVLSTTAGKSKWRQ